MSTPPRWTKEEPKPELGRPRTWERYDNGYHLAIWEGYLLFWWRIDGTEESGYEPTLHAAKCAATMALKRITKRSE